MTNPAAPIALSKPVAMALKALAAGKANDGQQKAALEWILFEASGLRLIGFEGERTHDSAFFQGRRFVGLMIAGAIEASPAPVRTTRQKPIREANSDDDHK